MNLRSFLYSLARLLGDLNALAHPAKLPKRLVNKLIGRKLVRRLWWR